MSKNILVIGSSKFTLGAIVPLLLENGVDKNNKILITSVNKSKFDRFGNSFLVKSTNDDNYTINIKSSSEINENGIYFLNDIDDFQSILHQQDYIIVNTPEAAIPEIIEKINNSKLKTISKVYFMVNSITPHLKKVRSDYQNIIVETSIDKIVSSIDEYEDHLFINTEDYCKFVIGSKHLEGCLFKNFSSSKIDIVSTVELRQRELAKRIYVNGSHIILGILIYSHYRCNNLDVLDCINQEHSIVQRHEQAMEVVALLQISPIIEIDEISDELKIASYNKIKTYSDDCRDRMYKSHDSVDRILNYHGEEQFKDRVNHKLPIIKNLDFELLEKAYVFMRKYDINLTTDISISHEIINHINDGVEIVIAIKNEAA